MPDPSIFASGVGCSVYTKYKINSHTKSYLNSVLIDRFYSLNFFGHRMILLSIPIAAIL